MSSITPSSSGPSAITPVDFSNLWQKCSLPDPDPNEICKDVEEAKEILKELYDKYGQNEVNSVFAKYLSFTLELLSKKPTDLEAHMNGKRFAPPGNQFKTEQGVFFKYLALVKADFDLEVTQFEKMREDLKTKITARGIFEKYVSADYEKEGVDIIMSLWDKKASLNDSLVTLKVGKESSELFKNVKKALVKTDLDVKREEKIRNTKGALSKLFVKIEFGWQSIKRLFSSGDQVFTVSKKPIVLPERKVEHLNRKPPLEEEMIPLSALPSDMSRDLVDLQTVPMIQAFYKRGLINETQKNYITNFLATLKQTTLTNDEIATYIKTSVRLSEFENKKTLLIDEQLKLQKITNEQANELRQHLASLVAQGKRVVETIPLDKNIIENLEEAMNLKLQEALTTKNNTRVQQKDKPILSQEQRSTIAKDILTKWKDDFTKAGLQQAQAEKLVTDIAEDRRHATKKEIAKAVMTALSPLNNSKGGSFADVKLPPSQERKALQSPVLLTSQKVVQITSPITPPTVPQSISPKVATPQPKTEAPKTDTFVSGALKALAKKEDLPFKIDVKNMEVVSYLGSQTASGSNLRKVSEEDLRASLQNRSGDAIRMLRIKHPEIEYDQETIATLQMLLANGGFKVVTPEEPFSLFGTSNEREIYDSKWDLAPTKAIKVEVLDKSFQSIKGVLIGQVAKPPEVVAGIATTVMSFFGISSEPSEPLKGRVSGEFSLVEMIPFIDGDTAWSLKQDVDAAGKAMGDFFGDKKIAIVDRDKPSLKPGSLLAQLDELKKKSGPPIRGKEVITLKRWQEFLSSKKSVEELEAYDLSPGSESWGNLSLVLKAIIEKGQEPPLDYNFLNLRLALGASSLLTP